MTTEQLKEKFFGIYSDRNSDPVIFFSPGRVNLIGEHTDYNMGYVFPCAINFGTYLLVRKKQGDTISLNSANFSYSAEVDLNAFEKNPEGEWINYPLAVIKEFIDRDIKLSGLDLLYYGDIPNGAGLSSSASIEMVTAVALNDLFNGSLLTLDLVKLSQHAENEFVGMNCGIMDQFAVGFGEKDKAIFLDCATLDYEAVPIVLNDYQLVIANTNKRRGLTDSKYNERRSECEKAVELINTIVPVSNLSDITIDQLHLLDEVIEDEIIKSRARHVICENNRVRDAVSSLKKGDLLRFGILMNESHDSLKNDYEVTGKELDTLVYEARKLDGVIGSRMTGAGFGGCTVSIVHKDHVENFTSKLAENYSRITNLKPDFYMPEIAGGAKRL